MGGWGYSNQMSIREMECFIEGRPEPNSAGTDFNHRQRLKHLNVEEGWTDREHLDIYLHQRTIRVCVYVCAIANGWQRDKTASPSQGQTEINDRQPLLPYPPWYHTHTRTHARTHTIIPIHKNTRIMSTKTIIIILIQI